MESQLFNSDKLRQKSLFECPSLDPIMKVKAAMQKTIRQCSLSREQIVDKMQELAEVEGIKTKISLSLLDKWVAQSAAHIIPWRLLPIFCKVTGSLEPIQALIAPLGVQIIFGDDIKVLAWAKAELQRRALNKKVRRLMEEIEL